MSNGAYGKQDSQVAAVCFAALLGGFATLVEAQPSANAARIGMLHNGTPAAADYVISPFREAMREIGYIEGKSVVLEFRYAEGRVERLSSLAADLVRTKVDVVVAYGPFAIRAAQQVSRKIPIIMGISHEPVAMGFVASFARPGGNITGLAFQDSQLVTKRLHERSL